MKISNKEIVLLLQKRNDWYDASSIADVFGVSTKTVTNYIKRINDYRPDLILSSNKGYALNRKYDIDREKNSMFFNDDFSSRVEYIIKEILFKGNNITTYDLADSLYISDSHLEVLLKQIKKTLARYELNLARKRNIVRIEGSELNKRRLISHLMEGENADFTKTSYTFLYKTVPNIDQFIDKLSQVIENNDVYINDFNFNTLVTYIIIMAERIKNNNSLEKDIAGRIRQIADNTFYKEVKDVIESFFNVRIDDNEYHYLCLIIRNNSTIYNSEDLNMDTLKDIVPKSIIDKALGALLQLEAYYHLAPADDNFKVKFILHTMLMFERINSSNMQYNQLLNQIKSRYPFVYDMAIYYAKTVFEEQYEKIPDSELGFLAIHLGNYLESSIKTSEKLKTCFVYVNYHNYFINQVEEIERRFSDSITIVATVSVKYISQIPEDVDLIISSYPRLRVKNIPVVYIDEFITEKNIREINDFISKSMKKKKQSELINALKKFTSSDLFYKNLNIEGAENIISYLCDDACKKGYCDMSYKDEVIEREKMSSTAFESSIAFAHSLYHNCKKSFISVCINDEEVDWDERKVNIILLVGSKRDDEYLFRNIIDEAIPFLSERHNVLKLLGCISYEEFLNKFISRIYPEDEY